MRNSDRTPYSPVWAFLAFVVVFIIYGSLFPFNFCDEPESFDKLLFNSNFFSNIADAIENLFLFVPLGFALNACFLRSRDRLIASLLTILLLGFGIQILQLYLPSRTASFSDVFWNSVGLSVGLLIASAVSKWFGRQLAVCVTVSPFPLLLVLLWYFYESFPFVPTLDYGLLRDHVKTVVFAPPFETIRFIQHLFAAILAGIALQRSQLFGGGNSLAIALSGALAVLLEIFVAYGSLRRETLLGMTTGLAGGYLFARSGDKPALITLVVVATGAYLITIFTPYRDQIADAGFTLTPFSSFLWRSVTRDLPPLAFEALAIGSLLWAGLFKPSIFMRHPTLWVCLIFITIAVLETIRVLVVGFHGDTTTLLIVAVLGSFAIANYNFTAKTISRHPDVISENQYAHHLLERKPQPTSKAYAISITMLAIALYVIARLPGIPYNIRELLPSGIEGAIAALCLSTTIYLGTNSPFLLLTSASRRLLVMFPLLLLLQGTIIWILLRIGVPLESIYDIVGAPVLGWPWEWEIFLRFLALHQVIATQLIGATLLVAALSHPPLFAGFLYWFIVSLLFAWPLHLIVVDWAATDNLTELMRDNASFMSSSLLATGILFSFIGGATVGAAVAHSSRRILLLSVTLLVAPLATICFLAGLEPIIVKYGKAFSAVQFLLSPDREHYLPQTDLLVRSALAYFPFTTAMALLQFREWNKWARKMAG